MRISFYDGLFQIICPCGWHTEPHPTLGGAGLEADAHMATVFPNPRERRPCNPGKSTLAHGPPMEYDPTLLGPEEGRVIGRSEAVRGA